MKIIGLGLSRTGTCSLGKMLEMLGFSVGHNIHDPYEWDKYDALLDMPAALHWWGAHLRYHEAKFIYTFRDVESWLDSMERLLSKPHPKHTRDLLLMHFGSAEFDRERFYSVFVSHDREIRKSFVGSSNFHVVDFFKNGENPELWDRLSSFLETALVYPGTPIPHLNKGTE